MIVIGGRGGNLSRSEFEDTQ